MVSVILLPRPHSFLGSLFLLLLAGGSANEGVVGDSAISGPNEAALISGMRGTRVAVGSTTWRWWVVESMRKMSLELMTLELHSVNAETVQGDFILGFFFLSVPHTQRDNNCVAPTSNN